jgi:hypothetical protein
MARTSLDLNALPVWARTVKALGFTTMAACVLLYVVVKVIPERVEAKIIEHAKQSEAHFAEAREAEAAQLRVLTQICANTAQTPEERAACWMSVGNK